MRFGVVYEFDCLRREPVSLLQPRAKLLRKMTMVEGDKDRQYDYLGEEWETSRHRKYGAVFTKDEFEQFIIDLDLKAQEVRTMGTLGAPGSANWYGCSPAICFEDEGGSYSSAYVTPYPDIHLKHEPTDAKMERWWEMIRKAVLSRYGDKSTFFREWRDRHVQARSAG